jgi:hypothetical protein
MIENYGQINWMNTETYDWRLRKEWETTKAKWRIDNEGLNN